MPFKTKSRKLAAKDRRFTYVQKFRLGYEAAKHEKPNINFSQNEAVATDDYGFVKRDLLKILLLASLVVFIQFSIFFFFDF
ncbi:hypothetical protein HY382_02655 [Candidatus Curtissbacteria bacterium]|nr:hypothetical protein [Candidatus Curtissbacteria bacterium]